jgi:hypothetical protein
VAPAVAPAGPALTGPSTDASRVMSRKLFTDARWRPDAWSVSYRTIRRETRRHRLLDRTVRPLVRRAGLFDQMLSWTSCND